MNGGMGEFSIRYVGEITRILGNVIPRYPNLDKPARRLVPYEAPRSKLSRGVSIRAMVKGLGR